MAHLKIKEALTKEMGGFVKEMGGLMKFLHLAHKLKSTLLHYQMYNWGIESCKLKMQLSSFLPFSIFLELILTKFDECQQYN